MYSYKQCVPAWVGVLSAFLAVSVQPSSMQGSGLDGAAQGYLWYLT